MDFGIRYCRNAGCGRAFLARFWNEQSCSPKCKLEAEKAKRKAWRRSAHGKLALRAARKRRKHRTPQLEEF